MTSPKILHAIVTPIVRGVISNLFLHASHTDTAGHGGDNEFGEAKALQSRASGQVHPPIVRITHWLNAIAMILMIGSGWRIYDDSPIFSWLYFTRLDLRW